MTRKTRSRPVIRPRRAQADASRRRKLAYEMAKTALLLHRTLKLHIETNSGSQEFARIDRQVTELKDQLNRSLIELLPLLPQSDAAASVAARSAMNELAVVQSQLVDYSRQDTTKKGGRTVADNRGATRPTACSRAWIGSLPYSMLRLSALDRAVWRRTTRAGGGSSSRRSPAWRSASWPPC